MGIRLPMTDIQPRHSNEPPPTSHRQPYADTAHSHHFNFSQRATHSHSHTSHEQTANEAIQRYAGFCNARRWAGLSLFVPTHTHASPKELLAAC
jgi:hypothetical protein